MTLPSDGPIVRLSTSSYRTERLLRRGPLFDVYLARDLTGQADVDLHVLHEDLSQAIDRDAFVEAAKALGRLRHRHVVPVFDAVHEDGIVGYVTPHLAGVTARDKLQAHGPAPLPECARILSRISDALASAHEAGLGHGRLVPECIWFDHDVIMLEGVGIVGALEAAGAPRALVDEAGGASPDVYALGAILFELIYGRPMGDDEQPTEADRSGVPQEMLGVVMRCLGSGSAPPFADAAELADYLTGHGEATALGDSDDAVESHVPDRVGPYRVLGVLGEGGMGVAYLAEQWEPLQRRVAVKVIKPGMDSRQVLRRFELERQTLAALDHSGIATVYDAGTTESGSPYFSMEVVPGEPLTAYCDQNRLSVEERVRLFIDVCDAVQHAHQRAIIHRDLKPANVLVVDRGGRPEPKIIDFGLAKALDDAQTESQAATRIGQTIGTPSYMSPEQFVSAGTTDTRTDVYSLGVMLYELLAGVLPYELGPAATPAEALDVFSSVDPQAPSARLASMGAAADATAERHGSDPVRLTRAMRGDLDWITMKALEPDRDRRYATVTELMQDLLRHLRHEPVTARPPSTMYQLGRWVRRHQAISASVLVGVVTLTMGFGVATAQMLKARRAERAAVAEAETARAVSDFMRRAFYSAHPLTSDEGPLTMSAVLDDARVRAHEEFADRPEIRWLLLVTIGTSHRGLGEYGKASEALKEAQLLAEEAFGEDHPRVALALDELGQVQRNQLDYDGALDSFERALAIFEGQRGAEQEIVAALLTRIASIHFNHVSGRSEQLPLIDSLLQRSIGIYEGLPEADPATVLDAYRHLALLRIEQGRLDEAEELVMAATERARGVENRLFDDEMVAILVSDLGRAYLVGGRFADAEPLFRESLATIERLFGPDHAKVGYQTNYLAHTLSQLGEYEEAGALFRRTIEVFAANLGTPNHFNAQIQWDLAQHHLRAGEYQLAEREILKVVPYMEQLNPSDIRIPWVMGNHGEILRGLGRSREAVAMGEGALALLETHADTPNPMFPQARMEILRGLGGSYEASGDLLGADSAYALATPLIERGYGPTGPILVATHRARAGVLRQLGRTAEADSLEALATEIEEAQGAGAR